MTLVLIVIAALTQAGLARRSLQLAIDANEAQSELQHRWLAASCRELFLEQADRFFIQAEDAVADQRPRWPTPASASATFEAAGGRAWVQLADEDSKLNLNAVHARKPEQVRLLLTEKSGGRLAPQLRPDMRREAQLRKRPFSSWGQVFDVARTFAADQSDLLLEAAAAVTCWGDGKLNIRRATDESIEAAASLVLNREAARKLIDARAMFEGDLLLSELLAKLELRRPDQTKLRGVLSDRSSCYSLWLVLETDRRRWYHLWIAVDPSGDGRIHSFSW